jgi:hypothetical protein
MKRATAEKAYNEVCSVEECHDEESCKESLLNFERKVSDIKHAFCSNCMCVSHKLELLMYWMDPKSASNTKLGRCT